MCRFFRKYIFIVIILFLIPLTFSTVSCSGTADYYCDLSGVPEFETVDGYWEWFVKYIDYRETGFMDKPHIVLETMSGECDSISLCFAYVIRERLGIESQMVTAIKYWEDNHISFHAYCYTDGRYLDTLNYAVWDHYVEDTVYTTYEIVDPRDRGYEIIDYDDMDVWLRLANS
jgi:hypothetical protein